MKRTSVYNCALYKRVCTLCLQGGFKTLEGIASVRRNTFLRRVPMISVRGLCAIEWELTVHGLNFKTDETLSCSVHGLTQHQLCALWQNNIRTTTQLRGRSLRELTDLGHPTKHTYSRATVAVMLADALKSTGIQCDTRFPLEHVGFSRKAAEILFDRELHTLDDLISFCTNEGSDIFAYIFQKQTRTTRRALVREVLYHLSHAGYEHPWASVT